MDEILHVLERNEEGERNGRLATHSCEASDNQSERFTVAPIDPRSCMALNVGGVYHCRTTRAPREMPTHVLTAVIIKLALMLFCLVVCCGDQSLLLNQTLAKISGGVTSIVKHLARFLMARHLNCETPAKISDGVTSIVVAGFG